MQNVTSALVERCKAVYFQTASDKTYLMYDLDVTEMLERLQKVSGAELLCSNPCFELWLLLHYNGVKAAITSEDCLKKLLAAAKQYKKGILTDEMIRHLNENADKAIRRANALRAYENPSTTIYFLIEELNRLKKEEAEAES